MRGILWGVFALLLSNAGVAQAQGVRVAIDPVQAEAFTDEFPPQLIADLETAIASEIQGVFNLVQVKDYLRAMADAEAFSSKGLGVDYASNPSVTSVSFAGNVTMAVGDDGFAETSSEQPVVGAAANVSLAVGINLGALFDSRTLDAWTVYVHGFTQNASIGPVSGRLTSMGAHAQFKILKSPRDLGSPMLRWGGLDLTSGIEVGRLTVGLDGELATPLELGLNEDPGAPEVNMVSAGRLELATTTVAIPFEATTNIQLLYFLTFYGGIGVDIVTGTSSMNAELAGVLTGVAPSGEEFDLGTTQIEADDSSSPSPGKVRFLAGVQANLWRIRLFSQLNVSPSRALGAALGARVAW